eukprot:139228-Karenia_brevis.AAC.1
MSFKVSTNIKVDMDEMLAGTRGGMDELQGVLAGTFVAQKPVVMVLVQYIQCSEFWMNLVNIFASKR